MHPPPRNRSARGHRRYGVCRDAAPGFPGTSFWRRGPVWNTAEVAIRKPMDPPGVNGGRRRHEAATPLGELLDFGRLEPHDLLPIIDAYEIESESCIGSLTDWHAWLLAGAGGIAVAAGRLLGATDPELFRPVGAAFGATRVIRWNHAM